MQNVIEQLKRWWAVLAAAALAILYVLFERRGQEVQSLKAELKTEKLTNELTGLKEESNHANQQASQDARDYGDLKRSNAELLAKLGIPRKPAD